MTLVTFLDGGKSVDVQNAMFNWKFRICLALLNLIL